MYNLWLRVNAVNQTQTKNTTRS